MAARPPRRPLVAAAGAVAAVALVVLGLRPTVTGSKAIVSTTRTTVPAEPPVERMIPSSPTSITTSTTTIAGDVVALPTLEPSVVPEVPPADTAPPPPAPTESTTPATTVKASPPAAKPKSRSGAARTTTPPTTAAPIPTARQAVLAYYDASNTRGHCVAQQPSKSTRAQLVAACGVEPQPPDNLTAYWAAKAAWNACAQPFYD